MNKVGKMLLESSVFFFFFLQEAIKSKVGTEDTLQSLVCSDEAITLLMPADLDNECQAHHDWVELRDQEKNGGEPSSKRKAMQNIDNSGELIGKKI